MTVGDVIFRAQRGGERFHRTAKGGGVAGADDGLGLARDGVVLGAARDADETQRARAAHFIERAAEQKVGVGAALVDLLAGVPADKTADLDAERFSIKGHARDGQRAERAAGASAADREDPFLLRVDVDEVLCLQGARVERAGADHADLLVRREDALQRTVGDIVGVQDGERHRDGDAVVAAERRAPRADHVAVHEEVEPLRFHILAAVRVLFADHVDMALQHDDQRVFVSGGGCLLRGASCEGWRTGVQTRQIPRAAQDRIKQA